jgi:myo-inositol catabolism protein IolC
MKAGRNNKGQGMHIERAQPECKGIVLYSTTVPTHIQQCSVHLATPVQRVLGKGKGRALAFKMTLSVLFHP